MTNWRRHRINRAQVLLAIREGKAKNFYDLEYLFIPENFPPSPQNRFRRDLSHIVDELIKAGLVESDGGYRGDYKVTEQLELIQAALDISLTDLSHVGSDTVSVTPLFGTPSVSDEFPQVFVLMPFTNELKPVYEDHIHSVVRKLNLSVGRADDFFAARSIITDIWHAIFRSTIVIADCTGRNPNVFYEIGVAHTVGKPTILISQSMDDVPFDLQHLRCIVYEYTPRGMTAFNTTLEKTLQTEIEADS